MKCICTHNRDIEQIGDWEHCPLENGGHTTFIINRCKTCGGISGFPSSNLELALKDGTEKTKMQLRAIIEDNPFGSRTDLLERIKSLEGEVESLKGPHNDEIWHLTQERDSARATVSMWLEANAAGGWIDSLRGELSVCRARSLQMQQEMEELQHIIEQCLDTGALRVDEHKQLFLDANRVLGRTPR